MQVKALQTGFYSGARVRAGQVFEVPEGAKAKWFVPIAQVKATAAPTKGKQEAQTLSQASKTEAKTFNEVNEKKTDLA